ncbi:hypothetical protein RN001_015854 [Aquatica leii]|uniref:Major facilitator superfamily (MFS) profile domain-containing protein n=1 Tax=Aquatica leii TaxID=1421715 RepID=A0AAN7PXT2_9COLE|nr:hypothetical protein RN001_015854 [Aquatica leii]
MSKKHICDISALNQDYILTMGSKPGWKSDLWHKFTDFGRKDNQHHLLAVVDTPCISASTTVTNFESVETLSIPVGTNNKRMGTLEENLKIVQPEIVPLQIMEKDEKLENRMGSINDSICLNVYGDTTEAKPKLFNQILTSISVSLVSMVVGFVSAYTSPAAESLKHDLSISDEEVSWIGGLMPLGALLGGLIGGQLIDYLGRKCSIFLTNVMFIISWICISVAVNVWYVYVGRAIAGFSVGITTLALPVYLGETIQPEVRGTLGLLPTGFGNIGILMCFIIGTYIPWDNLAWVGVAIPIPFIILAFIIPETPKWYLSKGKYENARKALQWLRGKETNIEHEFNNLARTQQKSTADHTQSLTVLFKPSNVKPLLISLGLMFFQQMSGINAVIFYTSDIFEMAGSSAIDKNTSTIIVGVVNFVSTFIATVLIDRLGRKILLYVSSALMVLTLGILGTYFYLLETGVEVSNYGWVPLTSFVIYVLGFSLGFGPIPWLMMGEILPAKIRGSAASVATAFNWSCTFIVTKTFVDIIHSIGPHGTFWMFSIICIISLAFVIIWVPETQGQSLEEIERKLAGIKVRRMSSAANLKPLPSTF